MEHKKEANKVCLVYRQAREGMYSIEKVFSQVVAALNKQIVVQQTYLPQSSLLPHNIWKNIRAVGKLTADIYHVTGDVHYIVLALPASKTVLTIHDCVFLHTTKGLKRWVLKKFYLDLPVKHCRMITTISEKSRQEIVRFSGCPPEKIVVVPNPVGNLFYYAVKDFNAQQPVLLFIGSTPNKNLDRVIMALEGITCKLLIVGSVSEQQTDSMRKQQLYYEVFKGLSEQQLADIYAQCDIVLFPSTYEGFGLPIIEGQKSGRPVITSNISPMKEVAGGGACLVDPFDLQSIKAGINKVMADRSYREQLVQQGFINVQQYEAAVIAHQYRQIYQKANNDF